MSIVTETRSDLERATVESATRLAPRFRSRVPAAEAARSIPRESIDDLVDAGLARLLVPTERGGSGMSIRTALDVTIEVAKGDASTGWISWLLMHVPHVIAMFPGEAQDAVWAGGPDVVTAGSHVGMTVERAPGGYHVSGKGAFTSGVNNADWIHLGGMVPTDGGPPELRYFLLEKSQYTVLDVWDTVGMRGTGSNTVLVDDVFVPEVFTLAHADAREGTGPGTAITSNPYVRLPWVAKGPLGFIATILGATLGAHAEVVAALSTKRSPGGARVADNDVVQVEVGMLTAKLDAAQTLLRLIADRADAGDEFTLEERTRQIGSSTLVVALVLEAIDKLMELAGTSGFASGAVVQQAWRDVHFASAHISLSRREPNALYGRQVLGLPHTGGMFY